MRMYDIIAKKRDKFELSPEEIEFFVTGVTDGSIPDYQTSALLMAIYFNGMTNSEMTCLTKAMAGSGDMVDLSGIKGIKADKHSTGGVGDKTTLVIAPIVAACGVAVAKMSGRGLGHTGGTVDKLESIPGVKTDIGQDEFFKIVNEVGCCVIGQSGNLAPADKKLYALRDVTATINSIPLIASSIMSKKLAAGSDCIVLDVKIGTGAFMKTMEDALALSKAMVGIGEGAGRKTVAFITDMDRPLGFAIGNALEIMESLEVLKGKGPADLREICIQLAANMLYVADKAELKECLTMAEKAIDSGAALEKFRQMIFAQGGDTSCVDNYELFAKPTVSYTVKSQQDGFISAMDTEKCGIASVVLGAGRETKESSIDFSAGIILKKKIGDVVKVGEPLATFYTCNEDAPKAAEKIFLDAFTFSDAAPKDDVPLIHARIAKEDL